jgi:hypothetical protein
MVGARRVAAGSNERAREFASIGSRGRRDEAAAQKAALRDVYALWSKARSAFASRNLEEAVRTAGEVKTKIDALSDRSSTSGR